MKKKLQVVVCACLSVLIPYASAGFVTGTSAVDPVMYAMDDGTGTIRDYYKYTIEVEWDSGVQQGVSHFEMDLSLGLLCDYALWDIDDNPTGNIRFENPLSYQVDRGDGTYETYYYTTGIDGTSTSPDEDNPSILNPTLWGGTIDTPDKLSVWFEQPLVDDTAHPDPNPAETFDPGATGVGTFSFYSTFAPQYRVGEDSLMLKADSVDAVGDLTGDLPYCVPEPATMGLLGLGALALLRKKK